MRYTRLNKHKAYTLVELLAVVSIMSILTFVTIVGMGKISKRDRLDIVSDGLRKAILKTQSLALGAKTGLDRGYIMVFNFNQKTPTGANDFKQTANVFSCPDTNPKCIVKESSLKIFRITEELDVATQPVEEVEFNLSDITFQDLRPSYVGTDGTCGSDLWRGDRPNVFIVVFRVSDGQVGFLSPNIDCSTKNYARQTGPIAFFDDLVADNRPVEVGDWEKYPMFFKDTAIWGPGGMSNAHLKMTYQNQTREFEIDRYTGYLNVKAN